MVTRYRMKKAKDELTSRNAAKGSAFSMGGDDEENDKQEDKNDAKDETKDADS